MTHPAHRSPHHAVAHLGRLGALLYFGFCALLFLHAYIGLSSFGGFGAEGEGRLRTLVASITAGSFLCLLSLKCLLRAPRVVCIWIVWCLWVLISCVMLFLDFGGGRSLVGTLEVAFCPLVFLVFYAGTRQNPATFKVIRIAFLALFGMAVFFFMEVFRLRNMNLTRTMAGLNAVYYVLLLLPWILVCNHRLLRWCGVATIILVVMWSAKRTALIALMVAMLGYALSQRSRAGKVSYWRAFAIGTTVALGMVVFFAFVENRTSGLLSNRLHGASEVEGGGRIAIYAEVATLQGHSSLEYWLFGHGHNAVREWTASFQSAHNDWLEVLFDYGLPGLILYCLMNLSLVRKARDLCRSANPFGPAFVASLLLFIILSLTSHLVLYPTYFAYLAAFWGAVLAGDEQCQLASTSTLPGGQRRNHAVARSPVWSIPCGRGRCPGVLDLGQ